MIDLKLFSRHILLTFSLGDSNASKDFVLKNEVFYSKIEITKIVTQSKVTSLDKNLSLTEDKVRDTINIFSKKL